MFMKPMLAIEREVPFDDERYLFEPMIDGQRLQLVMIGGKTTLLTRHGNDVTRQYPELHNVPLRRPADVVLDGEIAYVEPVTGKTDFGTLQKRFRMKGSLRIREAMSLIPMRYFVFDVLYYNGIDLREYPLYARKRMLQALLEDNGYYKQMAFEVGRGIELFGKSAALGLEGVMGKARRSKYAEGKSEDWIKIKTPPNIAEPR
ncbi:MAG: ligB [Paenibacillus sp.]|jgi:DNA ligase-1|nr:ligB [Paenibacillus sp.]